jgi:citronellyl-CoA synthetase
MGPLGFKVQPEDRLYLCLPIYHMTAMGLGFCAFVCSGATICLRRSFSASNFWPDVQQLQTNCFIYVGELCRYLMNNPVCPEELNNPLQKMLGNGLRPDIWMEFKQRFGIDRICEMYGASEGNVAFLNLLNKNKTIGACTTKVALLKYDVENDEIVRDASGRCIEVGMNEPGLLVGEINSDARFDGYTDPEATKKKILNDVFLPDDQWFNTGDLVRQIDVGFALGLKHFQFVDRTGDTFRWRAENVSTNEVAEVVNQHSQITMANVYGVAVPSAEGKAGMVTVSVEHPDEFDLEQFQSLVESQLPSYAQPVFIRLQQTLDTTVTFKLQKVELREQAYHLDKVGGDRLFVRQPRSKRYSLLDHDFYQKMVQGSSGY